MDVITVDHINLLNRCPIQLLQIGPILVQQFYCWFLCKTPRDFAEVYAPRMYNFGWGYPVPVFMFVVVLVYSTISPLILVFGVIYFAMTYLVCKYQLLYGKFLLYLKRMASSNASLVYFHSYEVAGRMWPMVFSRIIIALIIFELTSAGLFTLNKSFYLAALCVPLLFLTVIYKYMMDKAYQKSTQFLPLQLLSEKLGPLTTVAPILNHGSRSSSNYNVHLPSSDQSVNQANIHPCEAPQQENPHVPQEQEQQHEQVHHADDNADKISKIRKRRTVLDEDDYVAEPRKNTDFREPPMTLLNGILNTGMKQYGHPALLGVLPQPWLPMKASPIVSNPGHSREIQQDEEMGMNNKQDSNETAPLLVTSPIEYDEGGQTDEEEEEDNVGTYYHHPERRLSRNLSKSYGAIP